MCGILDLDSSVLLCVFSSPTPVDSKSSWIFWAQIFNLTIWSKKDLGQKIIVRDWTGTLHYFGAFWPRPLCTFSFKETQVWGSLVPRPPPFLAWGILTLRDCYKIKHFQTVLPSLLKEKITLNMMLWVGTIFWLHWPIWVVIQSLQIIRHNGCWSPVML